MDNKYVVQIPEKMAQKLLELQERRVKKGLSYEKPIQQLVNECIEKIILFWEHKCIFTKIFKLFMEEIKEEK